MYANNEHICISFCSGMLSHDAKLRCDLVDLYYTLYGMKVPFCLPISELQMITKPRKAGPPQHTSPEREVRLLLITYLYFCFLSYNYKKRPFITFYQKNYLLFRQKLHLCNM